MDTDARADFAVCHAEILGGAPPLSAQCVSTFPMVAQHIEVAWVHLGVGVDVIVVELKLLGRRDFAECFLAWGTWANPEPIVMEHRFKEVMARGSIDGAYSLSLPQFVKDIQCLSRFP
jgi:hypothetical protein